VPSAAIAEAADGLCRSAGERELLRIRPLLVDPISARRAAAARVLLARGSSRDRELVALLLADESPYVRVVCVALLGDRSHRRAALTLLEDESPRVRERAIRALGGVSDPEPVAAVRRRLEDASPRVRAAAVDVLAAGGHCLELRALASDPSVGVRLAARRALRFD
jgi:HEAT repeat protein